MKYFGTDGIRGRIGEQPLTLEFIVKLGWAIGSMLPSSQNKNKIIIGKDTRISGYMVESALQAGLSASGANVLLIGPIPSPAVAYLTRALGLQIGIVISASHNSQSDNGIKFYSSDGYKLSEQFEKEIEKCIELPIVVVDNQFIGKASRFNDAYGRYIEYCKSSISHHTRFDNLKIIIDCANGATYRVAPKVFSELGANVIEMNVSPNGLNINDNCGSLHLTAIQQRVMKEKADLGIAFDGDGDRVILVDHRGEIVDGDEILYIITKKLLDEKRFSGGVVGTKMSNMGLEQALKNLSVPFIRVSVGDQYVIAAMRENKWILGGEISGHITYLGASTTSDGIIAALQVTEAISHSGKSLNELKQGIKKYPQKLINIPADRYQISLDHPILIKEMKLAEKELHQTGRILLRYSGTEPVIRLMVEGENPLVVENVSNHLFQIINQLMNGKTPS